MPKQVEQIVSVPSLTLINDTEVTGLDTGARDTCMSDSGSVKKTVDEKLVINLSNPDEPIKTLDDRRVIFYRHHFEYYPIKRLHLGYIEPEIDQTAIHRKSSVKRKRPVNQSEDDLTLMSVILGMTKAEVVGSILAILFVLIVVLGIYNSIRGDDCPPFPVTDMHGRYIPCEGKGIYLRDLF